MQPTDTIPQEISQLLASNDSDSLRALFRFRRADTDAEVLFKYDLWSRHFFPKYFTSADAPFHRQLDLYNLSVYRGGLLSFVDIAFRGAAKTARTKLMLAFCILNDKEHSRRYFKVLCEDSSNSTQIVTDVYNMLVNGAVQKVYPEVFERTAAKREETMSSFTTSTGIKMTADTVSTSQRGAIQEDARPDLIWFEDFESRVTLRSAKKTKTIWDNMEEARTGLAKGGGSIYTCNYISELGNVHRLVTTPATKRKVLIVPIEDRNGAPMWARYTKEEIAQMRADDEDFEGERLCRPSASKDILFDRETLDAMPRRAPIREIAGFRMFRHYDAAHRYGAGADVAGGVGLDSSTSVFIDFDTVPARVVATFADNQVKPMPFGDELARQGDRFGECIIAPESNNHGHATIGRLNQIYGNIYSTQPKETAVDKSKAIVKQYGWQTNALTKPKMITALAKAVEDGLIDLADERLIQECSSYSRNDLMDKEIDPRLTTRHFDLLIAAAIAWQMKDHATHPKPKEAETVPEEQEEVPNPEIWG